MSDRGHNPCVFVVGCARSGTTLLQRMLDAHPQLTVANDTHFIPRAIESAAPYAFRDGLLAAEPAVAPHLIAWSRGYHRFGRLGLSEAVVETAAVDARTYPEFVSALYSEYARAHGKPWAGEKTPDYVRHLPLLHALFPWVKTLHIIRDGRDVALSVLEWATDDTGPARFELWREEPVAVAALWWRWQVGLGRRDGTALARSAYLEVMYEQLVSDPPQTMRKVADFLQLSFADEMLAFNAGKTRPDPGLTAKQSWLGPTPNLRDWRTQMDVRSIELFEALAGELLAELGYERRFQTTSPAIAEVARRCEEWWNNELRRRETKLAKRIERERKLAMERV